MSGVIAQEGNYPTDRDLGDYFGEVALLYDQPRNAMVTAKTDLRLLVPERDEFLRVVTGHEAVGSRAGLVADARSIDRRSPGQ